MNGWSTVWEISANRQQTKQGKEHLSERSFRVLSTFVQIEAAEAMKNAMGGFVFFSVAPSQ